MAKLDQDDVSAIAKETAKILREEKQDFWIPGEQHYVDHLRVRKFFAQLDEREKNNSTRKEVIFGWLSWAAIAYFIWFLGYSALKVGKEFFTMIFTQPPIS